MDTNPTQSKAHCLEDIRRSLGEYADDYNIKEIFNRAYVLITDETGYLHGCLLGYCCAVDSETYWEMVKECAKRPETY